MRLAVKMALGLVALLGAMYLFAVPTRTYLDQKHAIALSEHALSVLRNENAKLAAERTALQKDSTIERIARQQYGLVMPGQQAFMVLPSPARPTEVVPAKAEHHPWYSSLEFWDHL
ncbi:MAG: FtsB family cell division protein [Acidimicrobiales bacterium]